MKTNLKLTAFALVLSATAVFAQEPRAGVGVAAVGQMPLGDFRDVAGLGFGGMGGVEVGTYPGVALTARAGYIQYLEENDNTVHHIPLMGGVKLSAPDGAIYLAGELGAVMTRINNDDDGVLAPDDVDETNLGWGVGIGAMAGMLDIRLSMNVWDASKMSRSTSVGLSIGFTALSF